MAARLLRVLAPEHFSHQGQGEPRARRVLDGGICPYVRLVAAAVRPVCWTAGKKSIGARWWPRGQGTHCVRACGVGCDMAVICRDDGRGLHGVPHADTVPSACLPAFGVAAKTIPGPKGRRFVNAIVIGVVVLGMVGLPRWWPLRLFQPIWLLKSFAVEWRENGEELVKLLGPDARDVKIAVSPAGIIPFTTGLPAFDNLGLNTREVAMSGLDIHPAYKLLGNWPGHTKMASWRQLEEARVNLLINDPWIVPASQVPEIRARLKVDADGHPDPDAINAAFPYLHVALSPRAKPRLIVLPYPGDRAWLMLYLKPHAAVDRLLEKVQSRPQAADRPVNPSSNPL